MAKPREPNELYAQILDFKPRKADLRRVAILEAVIDCLAEEGVFGLSAESIGRRTKMRRSHVVYYFPNQDAMLDAAIRFVVATGQEITVAHLAAAEEGPARERLTAYVRGTFAWFERHPKHAAVTTLLTHYGCVNTKYRKLNAQIRDAGQDRLETLFAELAPSKGKKAIEQAAAAARCYLVGVLATAFSSDRPKDFDGEIANAERTMLSLLAR